MKVFALKDENGKITQVNAELCFCSVEKFLELKNVFVSTTSSRPALLYNKEGQCEYAQRAPRIALRI